MTTSKPTTQFTITAAHRITGRSRTTIQKHIKQGKLAVTENAAGERRIDASELIRVYGDACDFSRADADESVTPAGEEGGSIASASELQSVRIQLDTLEQERRREREQLQSQIDHLQESLRLAQEGHNRATLLLEDRSEGQGWQAAVRDFEQRFEARDAAVREEGRRDTWQEVKSLPWWRVIRQ